MGFSRWFFNENMKHALFLDDFPIKTPFSSRIFQPALSDYQRVGLIYGRYLQSSSVPFRHGQWLIILGDRSRGFCWRSLAFGFEQRPKLQMWMKPMAKRQHRLPFITPSSLLACLVDDGTMANLSERCLPSLHHALRTLHLGWNRNCLALEHNQGSSCRSDEIKQWTILRVLYEEDRVVSIKTECAREAEQKARRRFEDALLSAPKPGQPNQEWLAMYASCLHTDVWIFSSHDCLVTGLISRVTLPPQKWLFVWKQWFMVDIDVDRFFCLWRFSHGL